MPRRTNPLKLPSVKLPSLGSGSRNPKGWGLSEGPTLLNRATRLLIRLVEQEPAGEPPPWWKAAYRNGTKPEWAVFWALLKLGLKPDVDFEYRDEVVGLGAAYFSQIDFTIKTRGIAIEVQGVYWHYGQGAEKQQKDLDRRADLQRQGLTLIFIDEDDAIRDPIGMTRDALSGIDRSRRGLHK